MLLKYVDGDVEWCWWKIELDETPKEVIREFEETGIEG